MMLTLLLALVAVPSIQATCDLGVLDCDEVPANTKCDPCEGTMIQFRKVNRPAQENGVACRSEAQDTACNRNETLCAEEKEQKPRCPEGTFDCKNGLCIPEELVCNRDVDCGSNKNDEKDCSELKLAQYPKECPGLVKLGSNMPIDRMIFGWDYTKSKGRQVRKMILNYNAYRGYCREGFHNEAKQGIRLPYNLAELTFMTTLRQDVNMERYANVIELLSQKQKPTVAEPTRQKRNVPTSVFDADGNVHPDFLKLKDQSILKPKVVMPERLKREALENKDGTLVEREFVQRLISDGFREDTQQESFQHLFAKAREGNALIYSINVLFEIAQFVHRAEDLALDPVFAKDVTNLHTFMIKDQNGMDSSDVVGKYMYFFERYGVAFPHSGRIGGKYTVTFVMVKPKDDPEFEKLIEKYVQMSGQTGDTRITFDRGTEKIRLDNNRPPSELEMKQLIKSRSLDFVEAIGGTAATRNLLHTTPIMMKPPDDEEFEGELRGKYETPGVFENWVTSIPKFPQVFQAEYEPICELMFDYNSANATATKRNLCYGMLANYLKGRKTDKCKKCENEGVPVNIQGRCFCACGESFTGASCEGRKFDSGIFLDECPEGQDHRSTLLLKGFDLDHTDDNLHQCVGIPSKHTQTYGDLEAKNETFFEKKKHEFEADRYEKNFKENLNGFEPFEMNDINSKIVATVPIDMNIFRWKKTQNNIVVWHMQGPKLVYASFERMAKPVNVEKREIEVHKMEVCDQPKKLCVVDDIDMFSDENMVLSLSIYDTKIENGQDKLKIHTEKPEGATFRNRSLAYIDFKQTVPSKKYRLIFDPCENFPWCNDPFFIEEHQPHYLTTNCADEVAVACPGMRVPFLYFYGLDAKTGKLSKKPGRSVSLNKLKRINSITYENDMYLVKGDNNYVIKTRGWKSEAEFQLTGSPKPAIYPKTYSPAFSNHRGMIVIGPSENEFIEEDAEREETKKRKKFHFGIALLDSYNIVTFATTSKYSSCNSPLPYQNLIYIICTDNKKRDHLVFIDYMRS